jgi:D-glycero-alpha-D-manno-heptose 1-phosphate guanylyltransferase
MNPTELIILAGGQGSRLKEVVPDLPKSLAPVSGKPFLQYIISYFRSQGIKRFIFALGKQHEIIEQFLLEEHPSLEKIIVVEKKALGTGGALRNAIGFSRENTVAVTNGDTLFKVRLDAMAAFHHMCAAECTIALKPMKSFSRYGAVELNRDYSVANFSEKKYYEEGLVNGGVYIMNKRLFMLEQMPECFSFEEDYLGKKFSDKRIFGVKQDGYFIDIGIPEDYDRAQDEILDEI